MTNKLNEAQEYLNQVSKILKEDYGMGYEEEEYPQEEAMAQEEDGNIASDEERISQIREIALGGLQDYAHDVDGEKYQFFKKIWLMCDKAVSEKDSVGESN